MITPTSCNQLTLFSWQVKGESPMDAECQTMGAAYDCIVTLPEPKKPTFGWHKKNGSKGMTTIKNRSITKDIHMKRHFQVVCGI